MNFFQPTNTAQQVVRISMTDPCAAHAIVAVGMGGLHFACERGGYYFPDGSAITFTPSHLPVEYLGAYERQPAAA